MRVVSSEKRRGVARRAWAALENAPWRVRSIARARWEAGVTDEELMRGGEGSRHQREVSSSASQSEMRRSNHWWRHLVRLDLPALGGEFRRTIGAR